MMIVPEPPLARIQPRCTECGHQLVGHWSNPTGGGCMFPGCECTAGRPVTTPRHTGKAWEAEHHRLRAELVLAACAWRDTTAGTDILRARLIEAIDAYREHVRAY